MRQFEMYVGGPALTSQVYLNSTFYNAYYFKAALSHFQCLYAALT